MSEEPKITMSEFKTVIESMDSNIQKIIEVMQHEFGNVKRDITDVKTNGDVMKENLLYLKIKSDSLMNQVALLHEGQTEIKNSLKLKIDRDEFTGLEKRVAGLESKMA